MHAAELIAFVKERIHNAVEIDNLGNFGRVFGPPEKFIRGCGLAFILSTSRGNGKLSVPSSSYSSSGEN